MNILITGVSGAIGCILTNHWTALGHTVIGVSREPKATYPQTSSPIAIIGWDALTPEFFKIRKIDAVVNLSGARMMQKWNKQTKPEILRSREESLGKIYSIVRQLPPTRRPDVIVTASSVAIYSNQNTDVDETIQPDLDINFFQSLVWRKLEKRVRELSIPDVRTVVARIGLLIGPYSMMRTMLRFSQWGAGAIIGDGKQKISWISHHDLARAFDRFLEETSTSGTYNLVSPNIITAREMSITIADVSGRKVWLRIPGRCLKLLMGELAENFLISAAVKPARLTASGFKWNMPEFRQAILQAKWELNAADQIKPDPNIRSVAQSL